MAFEFLMLQMVPYVFVGIPVWRILGKREPYQLEVAEDHQAGRPKLRLLGGEFVSTATTQQEVRRIITFVPSVFKFPEGRVRDDLVSVMMPFSAGFRPVYEAITAGCEETFLRCLRADDIWNNSTIRKVWASEHTRAGFVRLRHRTER
jgi:hypothetical protein